MPYDARPSMMDRSTARRDPGTHVLCPTASTCVASGASSGERLCWNASLLAHVPLKHLSGHCMLGRSADLTRVRVMK
jgi:hypothetical protein